MLHDDCRRRLWRPLLQVSMVLLAAAAAADVKYRYSTASELSEMSDMQQRWLTAAVHSFRIHIRFV